jgi:hypothetical protein
MATSIRTQPLKSEQIRNNRNVKTAIVTLCLLLCINTVTANDRITIRDKAGRIQSTIQSSGNGRLVVRNQRGQITGSVTIKGGNAQYRNAKGQIGK